MNRYELMLMGTFGIHLLKWLTGLSCLISVGVCGIISEVIFHLPLNCLLPAIRREKHPAHHDGKSTHCQVLPRPHRPGGRHQPVQHTGRVLFFPRFGFVLNVLVNHLLSFRLFQALHNTNLLASYAAIDRRVKILCYVMKVFAKVSMLRTLSVAVLSVCFRIIHFMLNCITAFPSYLLVSRTDVWHRGCVSWQPLILRLHPHGAVLSPAEKPTRDTCASRGTELGLSRPSFHSWFWCFPTPSGCRLFCGCKDSFMTESAYQASGWKHF